MENQNWYKIDHPEEIDSPALLIYKDRVASNIKTMIKIAGDPGRLVPHVKTHKMQQIVKMQIDAGIRQFKCATIAEAEMLANAGAKTILLAYQLTGPKILRFLDLVQKFPGLQFASLTDNIEAAESLNNHASEKGVIANVYIDVDSGMHRTGIAASEDLFEIYLQLQKFSNLKIIGLHVYDGHIHDEDYEVRKKRSEAEYKNVKKIIDKIVHAGFPSPKVIAGGSPTFTVHAQNKNVFCSPGTTLLWDEGYHSILAEQDFDFAAVLLTRIISKPARGLITVDLGHKSVAPENDLSKRITFLNLTNYTIHSQSEEHLVVEVENWDKYHVGQVLYGVPYHVCPTVACYDEAFVIEGGRLIGKWKIAARSRRISV